jgi:hypothetical protein
VEGVKESNWRRGRGVVDVYPRSLEERCSTSQVRGLLDTTEQTLHGLVCLRVGLVQHELVKDGKVLPPDAAKHHKLGPLWSTPFCWAFIPMKDTARK